MKLIKQQSFIENQSDFSEIGIKKHIEKCTRVSYKSENRITDKSYLKFIDMLINRKHITPLEFGTVHLKINILSFKELRRILNIHRLYNDQWIRYNYVDNDVYITLNYKYYLEIYKIYPEIQDYLTNENNIKFPKRITVKFITSRVVAQEITRHRAFSFCMESQRYCAYNKDKFDGQVTYIIPCWMNIKEGIFTYDDYQNTYLKELGGKATISEKFLINAYNNEEIYLSLLQENQTPQQARVVLSNNVKTELYMCGFEEDWKHFFELRDVSTVDPQMYDLAHNLHVQFKMKNY